MEAKDTVMKGQQALAIRKEIKGDIDKSWLNECCVRQAEISFKAGMREVVEWVKGKDHPANISQIHITKQDWQAFLKEKGIEVKSE